MTLAYCYDFEFLEDGATINMISIGIACEDGREYYAINYDMDKDRISRDDWLCENVISRLPLIGSGSKGKNPYKSDTGKWLWSLDYKSTFVKPKWVIANEVRDFLLGGAEPPELWANYAAYDHVALAQLWGKMIHLPQGIPMWTHDLQQLIEDYGREGEGIEVQDPSSEHNALEDARWALGVLNTLRGLGDDTKIMASGSTS